MIDANYLGFPVRLSGKLPDISSTLTGKAMLVFGNLAMSSVLVERQNQTIIAISRDRALDADQILIRGIQRCDIICHSVGDASTRGPIAMLVGTA
jgi:HK97 family phage major capsid protein